MAVIDDLARALVLARKDESDAKKARIEAEEALIAQIELGEAERKTIQTNNGLKLTFQSGINYKLAKEYDATVPTKLTEKLELDVKAYEELRNSNPQMFARASEFVTTSPKKTAVSVAIR